MAADLKAAVLRLIRDEGSILSNPDVDYALAVASGQYDTDIGWPAGGADALGIAHQDAVACLAAQHLALQLAAHHAQQRDSSIGADSSSSDGRYRNLINLADRLRTRYYVGIGRLDPTTAGGSGGAAGQGAMPPAASVSSWGSRRRTGLYGRVIQ